MLLRTFLYLFLGVQMRSFVLNIHLVLKVLGHRIYGSSILVGKVKQFSKVVTLVFIPISIRVPTDARPCQCLGSALFLT